MTLLLIKNSKTNYSLLSPDTYGMDTWGMDAQRTLEKKYKHWYTHYWRAGDEWVDDYEEEHRLNVVLETTNITEIIHYLYDHKAKCFLNDILDTFKEIVDDYIDFAKWASQGDKTYEKED